MCAYIDLLFVICLQMKSSHDFEHSEMLLYQNMILRESGKTRDALKHLTDFSKFITDKIQVKELQGEKIISIKTNDLSPKVHSLYKKLILILLKLCNDILILESL